MKRKFIVFSSAFIVLSLIVVGHWYNQDSARISAQAEFTEEIAASLIKTGPDKQIRIAVIDRYEEGFLAFYYDSPISPSERNDFKQTDLGFAFFSKKNSEWGIEHSGEYGSIDSYLKQSKQGLTYEFFPNGKENTKPILYGIISDPEITKLTLTGVKSGTDIPVLYHVIDDHKLWYALIDKPFVEKYQLVAQGKDRQISSRIIGFEGYKAPMAP